MLPGDFGIHILIGPPPPTGPEPGFTGALLSAFLAWVLAADPARRRIVAEPDARNDKAIARFLRAGFVLGPLIDLPQKRARLVFLDRDAFAGGELPAGPFPLSRFSVRAGRNPGRDAGPAGSPRRTRPTRGRST
ncbi:MAG: hypothetical protein QOF84_6365 [Streptomyces sp.]|nr:hypothetical protein [Streptomyces sp.]